MQKTPLLELLKKQIGRSLRQEAFSSYTVAAAKHANIYTCGDQNEFIYFVESGQVKLLALSAEGKECLLTILTAGDIFGESSLSGAGVRLETATAMEETKLKQIPSAKFFAQLAKDDLWLGFVQYLACRIAEQQQVMADLVTMDSEQRLGKTLLRLARVMGKQEPSSIHFEAKISHEELSGMVGTTRPRISTFIKRFKHLGLIETNEKNFLVIKEEKLMDYLTRSSSTMLAPAADRRAYVTP